MPLLETALKAAKAAGIPSDRIYLLPMPGFTTKESLPTIDDLINEGKALPELEPLQWAKGQGARQVAYLCYSSGTSGLPVRALHCPDLFLQSGLLTLQSPFRKPS